VKVSAEILRQVKAIELRTRDLIDSLLAGEYRSVFRGQGIEFAEVRAYEQGDDYRAIDWNVSARMGHPYVKTFVEERHLTLLLVVDQSGSFHFGDPTSKSRVATDVAAILALAAARHNDLVGALQFSDRIEAVVPPARGRPHALRVIRDLLASQPQSSGTNLQAALRYAARLLHHRSIVAILSDFRARDWAESLARLASEHDVVAITVDDPRETELPDAGWVEIEDRETGQLVLVDTGHEPTRNRVAVEGERFRAERARLLAQSGVDHIALSTGRPYASELHEGFARRARRLKR
jgi:uncharacterized protein (DUF58 family)